MPLSSLPEEIQVDIFLRLPMNSIGISRCICKPFSSLLSSPLFLKAHLNHHTIQKDINPRLVFQGCIYGSDSGIYSIDYASVSSATTSKSVLGPKVDFVRMHYPFEYDKNHRYFKIMGSCNGLVCLCFSSEVRFRKVSFICLWNPLTREYRRICDPPRDDAHQIGYGFSYDCQNDDYKLVRLIHGSEAEVYTFGSDSWKQHQCPFVFASAPIDYYGVRLNGALHWKAKKTIVSFDVSDEIFKDFPLPEQPLDDSGGVGLGILESCLCLVPYSVRGRRFDIWVMQDYGVKDSWTKQFTVADKEKNFISSFGGTIWSFENGEILVDARYNFFLVDLSMDRRRNRSKNRSYRNLRDNGEVLFIYYKPTDYVESLVSLDSHTYVIQGENLSNASEAVERAC